MLTTSIHFKNFKTKKNNLKVRNNLFSILENKNCIIKSLEKNYKDSFTKSKITKYKKLKNFTVIGMGGSILGTQAIYSFLKHKVKKKFKFIDNLKINKKIFFEKQNTNLIVSKSGNTIETIVNANIYIKKKT